MSQFIENLTNRHFIHFQNTMLNPVFCVIILNHHQRQRYLVFSRTSLGVLSCLKCFCTKNLSILGDTMSWHWSAWFNTPMVCYNLPEWARFCPWDRKMLRYSLAAAWDLPAHPSVIEETAEGASKESSLGSTRRSIPRGRTQSLATHTRCTDHTLFHYTTPPLQKDTPGHGGTK